MTHLELIKKMIEVKSEKVELHKGTAYFMLNAKTIKEEKIEVTNIESGWYDSEGNGMTKKEFAKIALDEDVDVLLYRIWVDGTQTTIYIQDYEMLKLLKII